MDSITERFAKEAKQHREELHLTLKDVALQSGVSHSHVSLIERRERKPSLDIAVKLSNVLKIDLNSIIKESV